MNLNFTKLNSVKNKTYIPVLRSLFSIPDLPENKFEIVISKLFFKQREDKGITINTGLGLSDDIYRIYNSRKNRDIKVFSDFLSRNFFENKKVELFADIKNEKLITIGLDGGAYRGVNEIGDGIQSLLLLLFPIFTAYENDVFYIEEPETNLHPGFQRIFIETLLTNEFILKKNLKFFFTTHSNHFLDLTLRNDKVSFFQFEKIEEGKHLIKTKIKPNKETLDLLGVNNTSVFLANTSLWVEGPTDRLYLSKFLKLYCEDKKKPSLKEDIDFAFFEYGGNLIAHYLFNIDEEFDDNVIRKEINAFAKANKIYLLADNDNVTEESAKYSRQKNLESLDKENPYFKYQNTVVKEIENILPVKIIRDFMKEIVGENVIQKLQGISFVMDDYKSKGLGEFYEDKFLSKGIPKYQKENDSKDQMMSFRDGNTLKSGYKKKLARFVVEGEYTYDDLIKDNDVLKGLIENLYKFITEKKK